MQSQNISNTFVQSMDKIQLSITKILWLKYNKAELDHDALPLSLNFLLSKMTKI